MSIAISNHTEVSSLATPAGSQRLHALDALRSFALLLGIVLHATMSFFLPIPAMDASQSTTLGVTFFVIHIFRMSLFFMLAGYFAHMVFHRRGLRSFAKDRAKRIVVPMLAGWVVLMPLLGVITVWGMTKTFGTEGMAAMSGVEGGGMPAGLPLTHLWFLYYLCILYVGFLALRWVLVTGIDAEGKYRALVDRVASAVLPSFFAPLLIAVPSALFFYNFAAWQPWTGIPTPDFGLLPQTPALIAYGSAFTLGWILQRQTNVLNAWQRRWVPNLLVAAVLTVVCLLIGGPAPTLASMFAEGNPEWYRLAYTLSYTTAIWYWSFGLTGAALRFFSKARAWQRYLADASYWLYIAHLPIVFSLQVLLMGVELHWALKFPLILAITLTVLLLSYHYLVRSTFIGEVLNGRQYSRSGKGHDDAHTPDPRQPDRKTVYVAELDNVSKSYGSTLALDGLTLAVRPGELLAVLGPNGAGKSTAISLWLGLLEADAGRVQLLGSSPHDVQSHLDIGVMMQDVNLSSELTTRELIARTSSYYPNPLTVDETLALTGTQELAKVRYGKMSGGQKRQVQFAVAVCGRPQLLFLDEPTVGLDVQAREAMWNAVRLLLDRGCAIVLTTHYLEEAEALADRVAVLARGKLIATGSVDEMRALVSRKRISCTSVVPEEDVRQWPGVVEVVRESQTLHVTASDAESVVRRLLGADQQLHRLEVKQATLAEAFTELTRPEQTSPQLKKEAA